MAEIRIVKFFRRFKNNLKSLPSRMVAKIRRSRLEKRIRTEDDRTLFQKPIKDSTWPIAIVASILLLIGFMIAVYGAAKTGAFPNLLISDFYANIATELISIAITVLIIDRLNLSRLNALEKQKMLHQLSSRSNDFALDAVRVARDQGWLSDGSLFNYNLTYANLRNAKLEHAYMRSVHLFRANLENVDFSHSYLKRAFMEGANLRNAKLMGTDLTETVLIGANLVDADLWLANLENATLRSANLESANLLQTNLKGTRLENTNLNNAVFDKFTVWPENYDPLANGAIFNENNEYGLNPISGGVYFQMPEDQVKLDGFDQSQQE